LGTGDGRAVHAGLYLDALLLTALAAAALGSTPWLRELQRWRARRASQDGVERAFALAGAVLPLLLLALSTAMLSAGTFNPFIYFRF
jgi:ferric-dicitrate binding protein FerR (iron transport regulator)